MSQEGPGTGMQKAKQSATGVKSKGRPQTSVINAHDRNSNQNTAIFIKMVREDEEALSRNSVKK